MAGITFAAALTPRSPLHGVLERAVLLEQAGCGAVFVTATHARASTTARSDGFVTLGAMAALTNRVLLGAIVDPLAERHPSLLAKAASGLDVVAGGRALLLADARPAITRFLAGEPEATLRFAESIAVFAALFAPGPADHDGPTYRLQRAWNEPKTAGRRLSIGIVADAHTELFELVGADVGVEFVVRPPGGPRLDDPVLLTLVAAEDLGALRDLVTRRSEGDLADADGLVLDLGDGAFGDPDAFVRTVEQLVTRH